MKNTADFLNEIKNKFDLKSNYALAKLMGQTDTAIARWTHGKNTLSDESALQVADLLDLDPAYVIACIHAERAKEVKTKLVWERIAEKMSAVAAVVAVVLVLPFAADFSDHGGLSFSSFDSSMYIMSNKRRK